MMFSDGNFLKIENKLKYHRIKYAVGCDKLKDGDLFFKNKRYAEAIKKYRKASDLLGSWSGLKKILHICESKMSAEENSTTDLGVLDDILVKAEESRQQEYGDACEKFRTGKLSECRTKIQTLIELDPNFRPVRLLKWELKLVEAGYVTLPGAIRNKEHFLNSLPFLPPTERWKLLVNSSSSGPSDSSSDGVMSKAEGNYKRLY
ncbi:unnamed protein product [Allacma fusca]|uniref:Uncharacterized protein n=1 Tax=Allacma fusca TaxID=39272 RepID=A0A8J2JVG5_9HEXA|nr:unnamed protein product [Allacma fusca]